MEKLFIVVRADISPGLQIAQSCHALREFINKHPSLDQEWFESSNNLVVLQVPDEEVLCTLIDRACEADIPHAEFQEIDLGSQYTAVAFGDGAKKILSSLPLALRAA